MRRVAAVLAYYLVGRYCKLDTVKLVQAVGPEEVRSFKKPQ